MLYLTLQAGSPFPRMQRFLVRENTEQPQFYSVT